MVEDRIRTALREIVTAGAAWERPAPRRWPAATLAGIAVAAIVAAVALLPAWTSGGSRPVAAGGQPTLPEIFPPYAFGQGYLDGPFGRAIAMYHNGTGHEDFGFTQVIVAGADSNRYRRVPVPDEGHGIGTPSRLAPDGTKVIQGGRGTIAVIDLMTGGRKDYPTGTSRFTAPIAVSADSRRVAFSDYPEFPSEGTLYVLDLGTGLVSAPLGDNFRLAAFSPGGDLALQRDQKVRILNPSLVQTKELELSGDTELAGPQSWTPDGKALVTVHTEPMRYEGDLMYQGPRIFVFEAVSETTVPRPISADDLLPRAWGDNVLGWRSPTTMLVSGGDVNGTTSNLIQEVEITTGDHRIISRFRVGANDDLAVGDVQLATGLLEAMGTRSGAGPDRGVWPTWLIVTVILLFVPAALTAVIARHRRGRS